MRRVPPGRSRATVTVALVLLQRERRGRGPFAGFGGGLRLVPRVGTSEAVGERRRRVPSELDASAGVGDRARLEVTRSRIAELDDTGPDERRHRLGDLLDAHRYGALDVV